MSGTASDYVHDDDRDDGDDYDDDATHWNLIIFSHKVAPCNTSLICDIPKK